MSSAAAVVTEPPARAGGRTPTPAALALASLLALCVLGPALLWSASVSASGGGKAPFLDEPLRAMERDPPAYAFIGNSMLFTRLDRELLERELGVSVTFLTSGGAMSAQWYLRLKNHLAASGAQPRRVFILFRDDFLVEPLWRTSGEYRPTIESLCTDDEPVFWAILGEDPPAAGAHWWLPPGPVRDAVDRWLDGASAWAASRRGLPAAEARARVNAVFGLERLRKDVSVEAESLEQGDVDAAFLDRVRRSLLPAMLDVAAEHGLPLTFVRVQRRRRVHDDRDAPRLAAFLTELRPWLEARGAEYRDLNGHPSITEDLYGEGDHIAAERREDYTRLFLQLLPDQFDGTPGSPITR